MKLENLIVPEPWGLADHAQRFARKQAQECADAWGYAWLFRHHDEWQLVVSRTPNCPVELTAEAEFFQRKEKAPE